jgi:hypothetical protein
MHVLELIHHALNPFDPLHRAFCLAHHITDIPIVGVVPVGELDRGRGFSFVAWPRGIVRIV